MKKILYILAVLPVLAVSCNQDYAVNAPTLEVSAPETVKVGQKVAFELSGRQDILSFWSGEAGSDYAYKNVDRMGAGDSYITFSSTTSSVNAKVLNPAQIFLSYSTDFSGVYTEEAMNAATWTDITSEFEWPTAMGATVPAGQLNARGIFPADGSPVYFRFYYHVAAYDAAIDNGRVQWTLSDFHIVSDTPAGEFTASDMFDQRWQLILGSGCETIPDNNLPSLPTTSERILFRSQFKPEVDLYVWAVSGPVAKPGDLNLGHDKGMGIKNLADPQLRTFYYTWSTPGTYDVTFVGINAGADGRKEVVRSVKLKVVQDSGSIAGPEPVEW